MTTAEGEVLEGGGVGGAWGGGVRVGGQGRGVGVVRGLEGRGGGEGGV